MILIIKLSERERQQNVDLNNWSAAHKKIFHLGDETGYPAANDTTLLQYMYK